MKLSDLRKRVLLGLVFLNARTRIANGETLGNATRTVLSMWHLD
jgi:hypothetical protein